LKPYPDDQKCRSKGGEVGESTMAEGVGRGGVENHLIWGIFNIILNQFYCQSNTK